MPRKLRDVGKLRTQIGMVKGNKLRFLSHVPDCRGTECPLVEDCKYVPKGKCTVIYNFISSIYHDWLHPVDGLGDVLNQIQVDRIGCHLMPLYFQLIRFSMETYVLKDLTYKNSRGDIRPYPQFKEIREVLRLIGAELKDLGLEKLWDQKFGQKIKPMGKSVKDCIDMRKDGRGDPEAYKAMSEASEAEE